MSPAELQHATFSAMRSVLSRLVEHGPTVLALEDLHWADPTSLRLTAELARLSAAGPLLVLATRRPEPDPGLSKLEAELAAGLACPFRALQLAPIPRPAERKLARSLLGGEVGDEVVDVVCDGVDGNPLFLEERLASLLDTMASLGVALAWHGDLAEARQVQEQALASAERQGSPGARGAVLAELAVTAMRGGDVEVVRELAPQARATAAAGGLPYYVAAATALQAWVAWRDQRFEEALVLGAQALEAWEPYPHFYPYCLALWPLTGAHLDAGQVEEALGAARRWLEPSTLSRTSRGARGREAVLRHKTVEDSRQNRALAAKVGDLTAHEEPFTRGDRNGCSAVRSIRRLRTLVGKGVARPSLAG
jgi:hypothetical protein